MSTHLREEDFIPYLDGRLSPAERSRLDEHLAECAACHSQLDGLRRLMGLLGEWKAVEPSPGFDAALRARLGEETAGRKRWAWLRPAYAAGLALAVVVVVAVSLRQPAPPEPSPPPQVVEAPPPEMGLPPVVVEAPPPPTPAGGDELAVLDDPVLLEDYELLEEFDILFEPVAQEEKKL